MRGAWGNAGEIGHVTVRARRRAAACAATAGCLERYFSLDALRGAGERTGLAPKTVAPIFRNAVTTIREPWPTPRLWCSAALRLLQHSG